LCVLCSTVVGIRGKDSVVFGVERLVQSKLYEDDANKRIFHIDLHIGMVTQLLKFVCADGRTEECLFVLVFSFFLLFQLHALSDHTQLFSSH